MRVVMMPTATKPRWRRIHSLRALASGRGGMAPSGVMRGAVAGVFAGGESLDGMGGKVWHRLEDGTRSGGCGRGRSVQVVFGGVVMLPRSLRCAARKRRGLLRSG